MHHSKNGNTLKFYEYTTKIEICSIHLTQLFQFFFIHLQNMSYRRETNEFNELKPIAFMFINIYVGWAQVNVYINKRLQKIAFIFNLFQSNNIYWDCLFVILIVVCYRHSMFKLGFCPKEITQITQIMAVCVCIFSMYSM